MLPLLLIALAAAPAYAGAKSDAVLLSDARSFLAALVRLDTSNPPGNEIIAAAYLKKQLDAGGIESTIYTSTGTRSSLIARLKGSGAKRPFLLMCHTDVVPADPKDWDTPPFEPTVKNGYLIGRGTADIKSMCAAEAAILLKLKRDRVKLDRDVIFFAEADEESGAADRHIDWLVKEHGAELDAEFGVNEGGDIVLDADHKITELRVQAAEKEYVDVYLDARGSEGHASIPLPDNAVARVAEAAGRLAVWRAHAALNPVARGFLSAQERDAKAPEPLRAALRALLAAAPGPALDAAAERVAALDPELGAMTRDTLSPTMLSAGYKSNVIPATASAVFNARLLPGRKPADFVAELQDEVRGTSVTFRLEADGPPVPAMPIDTDLFRAIAAAAAAEAPKARVVPFMSAWSTDAQLLRARGTIIYGFDPPLTADDEKGIHGKNERLNLAGFDSYTRMLLSVVLKTAGAGPLPPPRLPSLALPLPLVRQETGYSCGAAAMLSVLKYWRVYDGLEKGLYGVLETTPADGTEPAKLAEGARSFGLKAEWRQDLGFADLRAALQRGDTPILDIQAWPDPGTEKASWRDDWDDGHYAVLLGMDADYAYFMDPSSDGKYAYIALPELSDRWHDEETRHGPHWRFQHLAVFIHGGRAPAPAVKLPPLQRLQ
jgi:acetylornithine deacetylase/succinyl-diaminopimelate desuccinylase-like protein/predicted double-glycine peptidase